MLEELARPAKPRDRDGQTDRWTDEWIEFASDDGSVIRVVYRALALVCISTDGA